MHERRPVAEAQQAAQQALVGAPDGGGQACARVRHAVVDAVLHLAWHCQVGSVWEGRTGKELIQLRQLNCTGP